MYNTLSKIGKATETFQLDQKAMEEVIEKYNFKDLQKLGEDLSFATSQADAKKLVKEFTNNTPERQKSKGIDR